MHESTIGSRRVFEGRLLDVDVLDVELDSGRQSVREIVRHGGAAVVLAQRPDGRFVLVRQYRKPVERVLTEAVAGTLEEGEDPRDCARRELEEETGYTAASLTDLGQVYPAPGYTDEVLFLYYARLNPEPGAGAPEEDEVIEVVVLTETELEAMIRRGEIRDAKTLAAWLLYRSTAVHAPDRETAS